MDPVFSFLFTISLSVPGLNFDIRIHLKSICGSGLEPVYLYLVAPQARGHLNGRKIWEEKMTLSKTEFPMGGPS